MSKTGTYAIIDGKFTKVSDRIPSIGYIEAGLFKPFIDRHIDGKPREFTSLRTWKDTLKANNMFEVPRDADTARNFWNDVRKRKRERQLSGPTPAEVARDALAKL